MTYQESLISSLLHATSDELSDAQRVYRNNYLENGIRALKIANPTTLFIIGEQNFRTLVVPFLQHSPKDAYDWADYGEGLSSYVSQHPITQDFPFLPDIIELDRQILVSQRDLDRQFNAESFTLLQTVAPDVLKFLPASGLAVLKSFFPLHLFAALGHEASVTPEQRANILSEIKKSLSDAIKLDLPRSFVVYRANYKASVQEVTQMQQQAWSHVLQAASVQDVLSSFSDDQESMTQWLQLAIEQHMLCGVEDLV